jgi:ABC-type Mn2+/Zn2+ transport system permease subunit
MAPAWGFFVLALIGIAATIAAGTLTSTESDAVGLSVLTVPLAIGGMLAAIYETYRADPDEDVNPGRVALVGCSSLFVAGGATLVFFLFVWPVL